MRTSPQETTFGKIDQDLGNLYLSLSLISHSTKHTYIPFIRIRMVQQLVNDVAAVTSGLVRLAIASNRIRSSQSSLAHSVTQRRSSPLAKTPATAPTTSRLRAEPPPPAPLPSTSESELSPPLPSTNLDRSAAPLPAQSLARIESLHESSRPIDVDVSPPPPFTTESPSLDLESPKLASQDISAAPPATSLDNGPPAETSNHSQSGVRLFTGSRILVKRDRLIESASFAACLAIFEGSSFSSGSLDALRR